MRLFVALDIADEVRHRIQRFIEGVAGFAADARWVRPESLHLTLKFIGEQSEASAENIKGALSAVRSQSLEVTFHGYGFFPGPKQAHVFWIGIRAGAELAALAASVDDALFPLNIPKETHVFFPHITLARASDSRAVRRNQADASTGRFDRLREKLSALSSPEFGSMTAREFFLYESKLSDKEPRYIRLAGFELAGYGT